MGAQSAGLANRSFLANYNTEGPYLRYTSVYGAASRLKQDVVNEMAEGGLAEYKLAALAY